ncbi:MAG: RNA chaperone Hfq [Defluviitaleaceae bacterium]|nr:RNA chaperone Hfq [Defluviitaleaceae bacterium]
MGKSYQDMILNQVRKENMSVTVYLTNGFQIRGTVQGFDNYVVLLESEGKQQMIYKHAISTIVPLRPLKGLIDAYKKTEDEEE